MTEITNRLKENITLVSYLPSNTTDRLQPMDISINKPAKECLKKKYDDWYAEMVVQQLYGKDMDNFRRYRDTAS